MPNYELVIGLEVHLELNTNTKCFCGCPTLFGQEPNTQTCPVCLGLPGSLPALNKEVLRRAIIVGLALNCAIRNFTKFDRKNYYYPDLPKNYQITQFDIPIAHDGYLDVGAKNALRRIGIRRVHMEEDAGKLIHDDTRHESLVDYNRAGMPLLEIVSQPEIYSAQEAYDYLAGLKSILEYLEVSDCDMEKGHLRCDANISLRKKGDTQLGVKVELKNMNSFKAIKAGLDCEYQRQADLLDEGKPIIQETRLWDETNQLTRSMRLKEESHDYRYFPEPDLPPMTITQTQIDEIKSRLPELPQQKKDRFISEFGIPEYDAGVLTQERPLSAYFEAATKAYPQPKVIANWILTELLGYINANKLNISDIKLTPQALAELFKLIDDKTISGKMAKQIFTQMLSSGKTAGAIVKEKGISQILDIQLLQEYINRVIDEFPACLADYKKGKVTVTGYLVGQVMKKSNGCASPQIVNKLLKEELDRRQ